MSLWTRVIYTYCI